MIIENSEIGKNVDQDEPEADFDDLNENIQSDLYHNGIGHGEWARLDQRIASANDDCDVSCNVDSEIQTILKLDTGSCKGRDFGLLSLRKERGDFFSIHFFFKHVFCNFNTQSFWCLYRVITSSSKRWLP